MHALIENGAVKRYPYSEWDLKKANPQVSFPAQITDATLESFGVHRVFNTNSPAVTREQFLEEGLPAFDASANRWTQVFVVRARSADDLASETKTQADSVRAERDEKLAKTDWRVISVLESGQPQDFLWAAYRQALRDITTQKGFPWEVQWPAQPK